MNSLTESRDGTITSKNKICGVGRKRKYSYSFTKVSVKRKSSRSYKSIVKGQVRKNTRSRKLLKENLLHRYRLSWRKYTANTKRIFKLLKIDSESGKVLPYKCYTCNKEFNLKSNLIRHKKLSKYKHSRLRENDYYYRRKGRGRPENSDPTLKDDDFVRHDKLGWENKPYECSKCGQRCHFKSGLARHMRGHNGEKPFKCSTCAQAFTRSSSLYKHLRRVHLQEFSVTRTDTENSKALELEEDLIGKVTVLQSLFKPFQCLTCNKCFHEKTQVRIHLDTHVEGKPYGCSYCNRLFKRMLCLDRHVKRYHTGDNPDEFDPSEIGKRKKPTPLRNICNVCYDGFKTRTLLVSHMKIHYGDQPYNCHFCDKRFIRVGNLVIHMKLIHNYPQPQSEIPKLPLLENVPTYPGDNSTLAVNSNLQELCDRNEIDNMTDSEKKELNNELFSSEHFPKLQSNSSQDYDVYPFLCAFCGSGFTDYKSMYEHSKNTHSIDYRTGVNFGDRHY